MEPLAPIGIDRGIDQTLNEILDVGFSFPDVYFFAQSGGSGAHSFDGGGGNGYYCFFVVGGCGGCGCGGAHGGGGCSAARGKAGLDGFELLIMFIYYGWY